jgi:hypothetical protein
MSRAAVNDILNRSLLDERFLQAIQADPDGALTGYDLTDEERSALLSRDLTKVAKLAGPAALALYCTIRFAMISPNWVAVLPGVDESRKAELQSRGDEITRMEGDRTEALKELLARMR